MSKKAPIFKTRFAPSPTGELHLGHAYSALRAYDAAIKVGGRFILRIEDTDFGRCRPEFTDQLLEDLAWLGVEWETPVRFQSQHFEEYDAAIIRLWDMGVLYRCFKTRKEMEEAALSAPHGFRDGIDGITISTQISQAEEEDRISSGEPFALRLSAQKAYDYLNQPKLFFHDEIHDKTEVNPFINGDIILARKDNKASYHLCAVHDDALQGISHIIRGEDLLQATHIQIVLQKLLGFETPIYHHHALIKDENGMRLAKRDKSQTLRFLRENGITPTQIRERLGMLM